MPAFQLARDHCPPYPTPSANDRVLIVDDDPFARQRIRAVLEQADLEVIEADCGAGGLDLARTHAPELILLDLRMPGMDGLETYRRLRALPGQADTVVVFLTASVEETASVAAFDLGADDYITKPFRDAELLARLRSHLARQRRMGQYRRQIDHHLASRPTAANTSDRLRGDQLVGKAMRILVDNLAHPPTVAALARQVGTNEQKLTRLFRDTYATTPFEMLRLLRDGDLPIAYVAEQVGYRNAGDFTTAFRRQFQLTPRDYRKQHGAAAHT